MLDKRIGDENIKVIADEGRWWNITPQVVPGVKHVLSYES